jgi:Transcriptional regulator, contains sigma factor-related N-terminal domain
MDKFQKDDLLIRVAQLYYQDGFGQGEISKVLGFSRPYISKLITEARANGIVDIKIRSSLDSETPLERKIRNQFDLRRVFAVPFKFQDSASANVGSMGARYINSIIENDDIIAFGSGNTVMHCVNNLTDRDDLENVTIVQTDGSMISVKHSTHTQEILTVAADKLNGNPIFFPVPLFVEDVEIKKALMVDRNIQLVANLQKKARISVFTVSGAGMGRSTSAVQSNYLKATDLDHMILNGMSGHIGGHYFKKDGSLYDSVLDERVTSLSLDELKKKPYRICVASGRSKYESVYAALCGGYVNVLIIDNDMAKALAMMFRTA